AFVDRGDARVPHMLSGAGFFDEAHAAVDLHAERRRFVSDVGRERLGDRRQQRGSVRAGRPLLLCAAVTGEIERGGGQMADSARGMHIRLHRHQHALNVGVFDDRRHAVAAVRSTALAPVACKGERLLVGALADRHPLRPDGEARRIHHHEHGGEPLILFADQPSLGALAFSVDHDAGGRGVDAKLVLDAGAAQVVAWPQRRVRMSTYVGQGAVRFYLPLNAQLPNDFFAQAVVVTKGLEQRDRVKARLERALATEFPSVVGRVYPLELGPPVGWPLQYRVSGPDPDQARKIASRVAELLGSAPGAVNVNYNWIGTARTVRIKVDQDQARLVGLNSHDLSQAVNAVLTGVTATQVRSGIRLVDVVVRASAEQRMSPETIRTLQVPLPNG